MRVVRVFLDQIPKHVPSVIDSCRDLKVDLSPGKIAEILVMVAQLGRIVFKVFLTWQLKRFIIVFLGFEVEDDYSVKELGIMGLFLKCSFDCFLGFSVNFLLLFEFFI